MEGNHMAYRTTRSLIWVLIFFVAALWPLTGCSADSLPQSAQDVLDEHIAELDGSALDYAVVSAQRATGAADAELNVNPIPEAHPAGACPPSGESETWCVVIDRGITDAAGHTISHFLVTRQGRYWDVESLTDAEEDGFLYAGCDNWTVTGKD
jgi:hypothetical protein